MIILRVLKRTVRSLMVNKLAFWVDTFTDTRTDRRADYEEVAENQATNAS